MFKDSFIINCITRHGGAFTEQAIKNQWTLANFVEKCFNKIVNATYLVKYDHNLIFEVNEELILSDKYLTIAAILDKNKNTDHQVIFSRLPKKLKEDSEICFIFLEVCFAYDASAFGMIFLKFLSVYGQRKLNEAVLS